MKFSEDIPGNHNPDGKTVERFARLAAAFEDIRVGGYPLAVLATNLIGLAFRDIEFSAAGGIMVPQLGEGAGREFEFVVDDKAERLNGEAAREIKQLWDERKLREHTIIDNFPKENATLLITPVVSGFENPIGCFWAIVESKMVNAATPRMDYVAKYVSLAVRAEKAYAAIEELSNSNLNVPSTSKEIAEALAFACRKALAAAAVVVWVVDKTHQSLRTQASADENGARIKLDMDLGHGIAGTSVKEGREILLDDLLDEEELSQKQCGSMHHSSLVQQRKWRAAMYVPLDIGGEAAGVISAYAHRPCGFSRIDLHILRAFANRLSVGYANADRIQHLTEMERRIAQIAPAIEAGRLALENVHDAINQLSLAQNYLSTAKLQAPIGSKLADEIAGAIDCVDIGKRRVNALTRLARFTEIRKTRVKLKNFLNDIIGSVKNETEKIRVSITSSCPDDLIVRLDEDKLQRVFANFLSNSLWFLESDTKGVPKEISITVTREAESILFCFYDNGPGIEPSKLPRIFDYLFTTRINQGMGLGLAIVRQIVEAHGGTVTAASRWGYNTEMRVRLPYSDEV